MLSIIVAIANNNVIGKDNMLLWHIPEDLKRFKNLTTGKTIIMGRKTFESLGRVLPNRTHIILCKSGDINTNNENVIVVKGIEAIKKYIECKEEVFVIGGGMIYKLLLPYVEKMYITKVNKDFAGDTYFPQIDYTKWNLINKEKGITNEDNPYDYEYLIYTRLHTC